MDAGCVFPSHNRKVNSGWGIEFHSHGILRFVLKKKHSTVELPLILVLIHIGKDSIRVSVSAAIMVALIGSINLRCMWSVGVSLIPLAPPLHEVSAEVREMCFHVGRQSSVLNPLTFIGNLGLFRLCPRWLCGATLRNFLNNWMWEAV